ncbi:MAG: YncE family protein [Tatlockia sp.]|nr:YncE family protein [Tatlockia sp.]
MIKKILIGVSLVFSLIFAGTINATPGHFFQVNGSGSTDSVNITLCLNGVGPVSCQNYNVNALNLSISTTIPNHFYPYAGIRVNTPGYTVAGIGVYCLPYINGYCLFPVSSTQPRLIVLQKGTPAATYTVGGTISGASTSGLILQNIGTNNLVISANATSFTFPQPIPPGGSYNVTVLQAPAGSYCTVLNGSGINLMANVTNIVVDCHPSLAYITNYAPDNSLTICPIDAAGNLGICATPVNPGGTFDTPTGIILNQSRTKAYIANFTGNDISVCDVAADGSLTSCIAQGNVTNFGGPISVNLNWTGSMAYISNSTLNTISQCSIDAAGMLVLPCIGFTDGFTNPHATAINQQNTRLYVVQTAFNTATSVFTCSIDNTGLLIPGSCLASPVFGSGLVGIAINKEETKAYVTSLNDSFVYICNITAGVLSGCVSSGQLFSAPEYIALNSAGTLAYVANFGSNSVSVCTIDSLGNFVLPCIDNPGISQPYGVYVTN